MKKMNKKGFTLIEMLVVIAIIAILVSIIIPVVTNSTAKAQAATNAANLRSCKAEIVTKMLTVADWDPTTYQPAATTKFYKCGTEGGFEVTGNAQTGVTVTWGDKTIQQWAEDAGQES